MYALLAEHREVLFRDGMFADLFPPAGALQDAVISSVLVLQTLQDLSDR